MKRKYYVWNSGTQIRVLGEDGEWASSPSWCPTTGKVLPALPHPWIETAPAIFGIWGCEASQYRQGTCKSVIKTHRFHLLQDSQAIQGRLWDPIKNHDGGQLFYCHVLKEIPRDRYCLCCLFLFEVIRKAEWSFDTIFTLSVETHLCVVNNIQSPLPI